MQFRFAPVAIPSSAATGAKPGCSPSSSGVMSVSRSRLSSSSWRQSDVGGAVLAALRQPLGEFVGGVFGQGGGAVFGERQERLDEDVAAGGAGPEDLAHALGADLLDLPAHAGLHPLVGNRALVDSADRDQHAGAEEVVAVIVEQPAVALADDLDVAADASGFAALELDRELGPGLVLAAERDLGHPRRAWVLGDHRGRFLTGGWTTDHEFLDQVRGGEPPAELLRVLGLERADRSLAGLLFGRRAGRAAGGQRAGGEQGQSGDEGPVSHRPLSRPSASRRCRRGLFRAWLRCSRAGFRASS